MIRDRVQTRSGTQRRETQLPVQERETPPVSQRDTLDAPDVALILGCCEKVVREGVRNNVEPYASLVLRITPDRYVFPRARLDALLGRGDH